MALRDSGVPWFAQLLDKWKSRFSFDPIEMEYDLERAGQLRSSAAWVGIFGGLVPILVLMTYLGWHMAHEQTPTGLSFVLWIVGIAITQIAILLAGFRMLGGAKRIEEQYAGKPRISFLLTHFFECIDWSYPRDMDINAMKKMARLVLEKKAYRVVELEKMFLGDKDKLPADWGARVDKKRREVTDVRKEFNALGIAHDNPTEYYRAAEHRWEDEHSSVA
jgi:hypothetical protein